MEFTSVELVSAAELAALVETVAKGARDAVAMERERRRQQLLAQAATENGRNLADNRLLGLG
jgi:hypothetical protein